MPVIWALNYKKMQNSEEAEIIGPSLREFLVDNLEYAGNKILEWAKKLKTP